MTSTAFTLPSILAVAQSALISLLAGGVFWLLLRQFHGVSPNTHRLIWFGVLLLGLCIVRCPVHIPYYEPEPAITAHIVPSDESQIHGERYPAQRLSPEIDATVFSGGLPLSERQRDRSESGRPPWDDNKTSQDQTVARMILILAVWLGGVLALLVRRGILFVQLHLRLRSLPQATAPEWARLLSLFGIAPGRIPVSWTDVTGPALVRSLTGYRLLFPRSLWDELSPAHREGVLRHELSHYLSGDAWLAELARLLATLQWFNPMAWLALRKLDEAAEWRCDDFAYCNSGKGPKDLIETLFAVHESTESLGLYLSSFARIHVIARINRLVEHQSQPQKENALMKKTLLLTLFLAFLLAGLLQIQLVAKPQTDARKPAEPEPVADAVTEEKHPALDAETQKLLALAESMVTLPDVTVERLRDVAEDLSKKTYFDPPVPDVFYERIIALCDKVISLEPDTEMLSWAYGNKLSMLQSRAYIKRSDESVRALEDFAAKTSEIRLSSMKFFRESALNMSKAIKILQLERPEFNTTMEKFLAVRSEICDYIKTTDFSDLYLARLFVDVSLRLRDRKIITQEQLLDTFAQVITALNESLQAENGYTQIIQSEVENKLAFLQAEGKMPEMTGTDMNGNPFDWNVYRGKTVLMAFTSSWYGGREMQDMLELTEEFAGQGVEWITYVGLNDKDDSNDAAQEIQWLELCVSRLNYPGTVLTQIETLEGSVRGMVDKLSQRQYSSNYPQFVIVDEDGKIIALGRTPRIREKLVSLFGKPSEEAIARGHERSKMYNGIPKPCISNFRELALAIHNYYDTHKIMPPAYTIDEKGNKLHSWRVLLLPYLGYEDIYSQIRLDEPWNSEYNKQFNDMVLPVFQCHEIAFADHPKPVTTYAAIVGREGVFEENGKQIGFIDIRDGMSNTLLFVERATPVNWMEPTDITFDEAVKGVGVSANGIAAPHQGGGNCAFCDGSTRFLPADIKPEVLRAVLTRSGGESVSFPE